MGTQQLLLIILGVLIVGVAIAVGLMLFSSQSNQAAKDLMVNDLNHIAAQAYQFKSKTVSMGGGDGSYTSYAIPLQLVTNENATYSIGGATQTTITLVAVSLANTTNTITVIADVNGTLDSWTYTGDFQ